MPGPRSLLLCDNWQLSVPSIGLIQIQDVFRIEDLLFEIDRVTLVTTDEITIPGDPVRPISIIVYHFLGVGNVTNFPESDKLGIIGQALELVVSVALRRVISFLCIDIHADNIHNFITGVPIWRDGIPHPNEVVQAMFVGQTVEKQVIEGFARLSALCAPPEPATFCLVKRPEQDWNVGVLQPLQLLANRVDITQNQFVVGRILAHGSGQVKTSGFCVEIG